MTSACIALTALTLCGAPQVPPSQQTTTDRLAEFVTREWPGERQQQALTVTALNLTADAIDDVAKRNGVAANELNRDISKLRELIERYSSGTPGDVEQTSRLERALKQAASLINDLAAADHQRRTKPADLNAMERAVSSLDDDAPLRRQPDVIERFFTHAVALLRGLNARP